MDDVIRLGMLSLDYDTEAGTGWPGARYAPKAIRENLKSILDWRMEDEQIFDVCNNYLIDFSKIDLRDYGDCSQIIHHDHFKAINVMKDRIEAILDDGYLPVLLGGDHSVTNSGLMALHEKCSGKIGIIDIDAHLDIKIGDEMQGRYSGSSQIRRALEMERYDPQNAVEIGPRGYNYPEHYHFIRESGLTVFTPRDVYRQGVEEIIEKTLDIARNGTEHIYLTVDIDALDMAFAPGSGGQEPAGLSHFQVSNLIQGFAPYVDVIDLVEVNPMTDYRNFTAHAGALLILDFISSLYNHRFLK